MKEDNNIIYMHDLITGINNDYCEERFINDNNSSNLILNPYKGDNIVTHKNGNSLINVDDNLIITKYLPSYNDIDYSDYLVKVYYDINEDEIYETKLQTILNIEDDISKYLALPTFKGQLLSLKKDKIFGRNCSLANDYIKVFKLLEEGNLTSKDLVGLDYTLHDIYNMYDEIYRTHESEYFGGHVIELYPIIKTLVARTNHICCFSGAIIPKGKEYISYKLFIEDLTSNCLYCSKSISVEVGYEHNLPTTISELDSFLYKSSRAYELNLDDYYEFNSNVGYNDLGISLIKKR